MIDLITKNKEFFGIAISFLAVIIPLAVLLITKNKEQKQISFKRFHNDLMSGLSNSKKIKLGLDQQVAILYELRNYPEYYPVIKRLLKFQINRWKKLLNEAPHFSELIQEAKETTDFINKNYFDRLIIKIKNKIKLF